MAGVVVAAADANDSLLNKRVFLVPMRGWEDNPDAPESTWVIITYSIGTSLLTETVQFLYPWWRQCCSHRDILSVRSG